MSLSKSNQHNISGAVYVDPPIQPPHFQYVCWENIFDYCSLHDIFVMSQTCKRMQQIARCYFQEYCSNTSVSVDEDNENFGMPEEFISILEFEYNLNHILTSESFPSLKTLMLTKNDLEESQYDSIRGVLNNLVHVSLSFSAIHADVDFEQLLNSCKNIEKLRLYRVNCYRNPLINDWFHGQLPKLKCLELVHIENANNFSLRALLKQNSNIKCLGIDCKMLYAARESLLMSNVQLDSLTVYDAYHDEIEADRLATLLNDLHGRSFYKSLILDGCSQEVVNNMASFITLEKIHLFDDTIDLLHIDHPLNHLKELKLVNEARIININMDTLAKHLTKLEILEFNNPDLPDVLPFLRYLKRLRKVSIGMFQEMVLDAYTLNEERKKLEGARKVYIYLDEETYLPTKWLTENLNLDLIEIKRIESDDSRKFNEII